MQCAEKMQFYNLKESGGIVTSTLRSSSGNNIRHLD